jgi:hypothetical protein
MNLVIRSASPELASQLSLLTHAAELEPSTITFDKQTSSITIPVRRKQYLRRWLFFGLGERYQQVSPETIESFLIVRDVLEFRPVDRFSLPRITLLFGVKLTENEIYLCSAEESKGIIAFELLVKIRSYDIELRDRE